MDPEPQITKRGQYDPSRYRPEEGRRKWLRTYGITPDSYQALLGAQSGKCAICGDRPTTIRLGVDHCHLCGGVRGLLCMKCNNAIGLCSDSMEVLAFATAYLEHPPVSPDLTENTRHQDRDTFNTPRGSRHHRAIITETTAKAIKGLYRPGKGHIRKLASKLGVSVNIVKNVVHGHCWKYVT